MLDVTLVVTDDPSGHSSSSTPANDERIPAGGVVTEIEDEPHIEGRRLTVRRIGALAEKRGLHPESIAERFDLTLDEVTTALAYYYDHADLMAELAADRRSRIDASRGESIAPADVLDEPPTSE